MNCLVRYCFAICTLLAASSIVYAADTADCHLGTYRLADGALVDIAPADDHTLRWLKFDGATGRLHPGADGVWKSTYGWTDRADGIAVTFSACPGGQITFGGVSGQRIAFDVQEVTFRSHGTVLAGRLVMPRNGEPVPIVVLLHGSEPASALTDSSLQTYFLQHMLPAEGVGAFVYDKRGTGRSGGHYTQDYSLLADDAVAALREARALAGTRARRIGYQGGSQAGWVAPLAANRTAADFVIVCFGLAVNVIDEDQEAVELQMREKGYPPEVVAEAREVASAAEAVFESDFKDGFAKLDEMRAKYGSAPWYRDVRGDYAFFVLQQESDAKLRALAPQFDWHTPFHYDPMQALRADKVPQLWILGGEDYQAPSAETSRRIKSLTAEGLPFTLAYYPGAEHGMTLFETGADGSRVSTRYAGGYLRLIRDFARDGKLHGTYGDAEVTAPAANPVTPDAELLHRPGA
jgi:dienelactone hydrolase